MTEPQETFFTLEDERLASWQAQTRLGNAAFSRCDARDALFYYRQALHIARELAGRCADADQALAALVISYHNLVDFCRQQQFLDTAANLVCSIHHQLCLIAANPECHSSWRDAALRHSKYTHRELCRYVELHGDHPKVSATLNQTMAAFCPASSRHHH